MEINDVARAGFVDRVLSTSYVATWPATRQAEIVSEVRALVSDFPMEFPLPYVTDVFWCNRPS